MLFLKTVFNYQRLTLSLIGLLLAVAWPALANGGTILLAEEVGAYKLTVTGSPDPLRVGVNDISALIGRLSDQLPLLEAEVIITAEPVDHAGQPQTFSATHNNATNKLYYAANVLFPTPGRWRLTVQVNGPEGPASAAFEVQVEQESALGSLTYPLAGIAIGAVVFYLAVMMGRKSRAAWQKENDDILVSIRATHCLLSFAI